MIVVIKLLVLVCVGWCVYRGYVHAREAYDKYIAGKEEKK